MQDEKFAGITTFQFKYVNRVILKVVEAEKENFDLKFRCKVASGKTNNVDYTLFTGDRIGYLYSKIRFELHMGVFNQQV